MSELPARTRTDFVEALRTLNDILDIEVVAAPLLEHYEALRRWNPRTGLVSARAGEDPIARHYLESLCLLRLVGPDELAGSALLDIGSGAGFPGLILALACPGLSVTLVERRQKKAAFLGAVIGDKAAASGVSVIDAPLLSFLSHPSSPKVDFVTLRAVHLHRQLWRKLFERLPSSARIALWAGPRTPIPGGLELSGQLALPASRERQLLLFERA